MQHRRINLLIMASILSALLRSISSAQNTAAPTEAEFWPEVQAYIKLNPKFRLFFNGSVSTSVEDGELLRGNAFEALVGAHLDYIPSNHFVLRAGYRYIFSLDESDPYHEHRVILEQTPRHLFPGQILVSDRNREDFRSVNGDFSFRYRNRLTAEREFQVWKRSWTPYGSIEVFYDSRFNAWSRNRWSTGIVLPVRKRLAPLKLLFPDKDVTVDLYYLRQNDRNPSEKHVNAFGITIAIHQ
jgi:hypothetical protein